MPSKSELVKSLRDLRPVDSLILLPDNPRHGDVGAISQSLERFGQQKPIVINSDGVILAGNHTFQAAVALGWTDIWVSESSLEGVDQPGFALADNRLSDLATYDHDALLRYLEEQSDLTGTGWDADDMGDIYRRLNTPLAADWADTFENREAVADIARNTLSFALNPAEAVVLQDALTHCGGHKNEAIIRIAQHFLDTWTG